MAGVSTGQGDNKLNTELNLVPFIDLLSTLTLFLLVTAVWLQVAAIPASVKSKGRSATAVSQQGKIMIQVTNAGYGLSWPSGVQGPKLISKTREGYDSARLSAVLAGVLKSHNALTAAVSADDLVGYGAVVEAVDSARAGGVTSVALSP
jgi:biopolymer transport protein ExbD